MRSRNNKGWDGWIFGLQQNGVTVYKFGEEFTTGSNMELTDIQIRLNSTLNVVVLRRGNLAEDIGFTIFNE